MKNTTLRLILGVVIAGNLLPIAAAEEFQEIQAVSYFDDSIPCVDQFDAFACDDADFGAGLFDNIDVFAGLDGSKQPQDFGVNAQFGGRLHANWGIPLVKEWGLGAQLGTGVNLSDHAVRVTSQIDGAGSREQSFTTVGLFQRFDNGLNWGVSFDYLAERDYDVFRLSQWRGRIGYQLTPCDEVGVFGMLPQSSDRGTWAGIPVELESIAQGSVYWRHTFAYQAEITGWLGVAEGHSRANVALGDASALGQQLVFGSDLQIPLNDTIALYGEANFIMPADTGTVDAVLGFAIYPGGGARGARKRRFAPLLPVANNTSFSVNLTR